MRWFKTERALHAVGLGLMFSALGCGGRAADDSGPEAPSYNPPSATAASPPVASPPYRSQAAPPMNPPEQQSQPPRPSTLGERPQVDLSKAAAENVLLANCGQCHGPALTQTQAQDGINYISDIDALVQAGLIVPMSSAASRLVVVMRDGSMPPPASGLPPVTDADIEVVASYIDNPRHWPDFPVPGVVDAGTGTPSVDAGADGG